MRISLLVEGNTIDEVLLKLPLPPFELMMHRVSRASQQHRDELTDACWRALEHGTVAAVVVWFVALVGDAEAALRSVVHLPKSRSLNDL